MRVLCRRSRKHLLKGFGFYTLLCDMEGCSVLGMYLSKSVPKGKCACKLHDPDGEHYVAETCHLVEQCIRDLGCRAQLYQEWYVLGGNNKKKYKVDIVVQLENGYVGIEVHGSKEHEVDMQRVAEDVLKAQAWKKRMGTPLITVRRPSATQHSLADGSWGRKHVKDRVKPALEKAM